MTMVMRIVVLLQPSPPSLFFPLASHTRLASSYTWRNEPETCFPANVRSWKGYRICAETIQWAPHANATQKIDSRFTSLRRQQLTMGSRMWQRQEVKVIPDPPPRLRVVARPFGLAGRVHVHKWLPCPLCPYFFCCSSMTIGKSGGSASFFVWGCGSSTS